MLALTRKTDYALLALAALDQAARQDQPQLSARQIAQQFHLPEALMMNVMKDLARARLVVSSRGAGGGYRLAMPAQKITVAHVVAAIEGEVRFSRCAHDAKTSAGDCDLQTCCPIHQAIGQLHQRIKGFLDQVTIADLTSSRLAVGAGVLVGGLPD